MGLDVNSLNLLGFAKKQGVDFSKTLSVGRAAICMEDDDVGRFLEIAGRHDLVDRVPQLTRSKYYEDILSAAFGAKELDAVDVSDYEGASIIHNLNEPLDVPRRFTAILDFGCLEHVFNVPVAIDNLINLCEAGGHILHYLPANNCCGHGFYQFSPELFFSLYSEQRGFSGTRVFFVEWQDDPSVWFEIKSPQSMHGRVTLANHYEGYLLVITRRGPAAVSPLASPPNQSDYLDTWQADQPQTWDGTSAARLTPVRRLKHLIKRILPLVGLERQGWRLALRLSHRKKQVRRRRDDVVKLKVADLVRG